MMKSSRSRSLIVLRIQAKGHNCMALVSVNWLTKAPRYLLTLLTITSSCSWSLTSIGSIGLVDGRNITTFNSAARSYQQSITCLLRTIWIQKPSLSVINIYSPGIWLLILNLVIGHFPITTTVCLYHGQKLKLVMVSKHLIVKRLADCLLLSAYTMGISKDSGKQQTSWGEMHLLVTINLWITKGYSSLVLQ